MLYVSRWRVGQASLSLQGSSVGHSFEQLRFMVDAVHDRSRIGVCLDTCHMFAAGYDISTRDGYKAVMAQFGDIVGWQYLKGECSVLSLGQYVSVVLTCTSA